MPDIKVLIKIAIYVLIIYIIGSMIWQFIAVNVKKVNISGEIKTLLYGDIKSDEYILRDKIFEKLKKWDIYIEYDAINVMKVSNSRVKFNFEYTDSIGIPFINKYFYLNQKVDEIVTRR